MIIYFQNGLVSLCFYSFCFCGYFFNVYFFCLFLNCGKKHCIYRPSCLKCCWASVCSSNKWNNASLSKHDDGACNLSTYSQLMCELITQFVFTALYCLCFHCSIYSTCTLWFCTRCSMSYIHLHMIVKWLLYYCPAYLLLLLLHPLVFSCMWFECL